MTNSPAVIGASAAALGTDDSWGMTTPGAAMVAGRAGAPSCGMATPGGGKPMAAIPGG